MEKAVVRGILEYVKFADLLPITTMGALSVKVLRWKRLPTTQFRALNESFPASAGSSEQLEESVFIAGGNIDLDRQFDGDKNSIVDPRQNQFQMFMASLTYNLNDKLINGDPASDPKTFTGIKVRVGNLPSRQTVSGDTASSGLVVQTSSATRHTFLDKLNETMHMVAGGADEVDVLLCNTNSYLGLESVLRREGLLNQSADAFERKIYTYRGARLIDMGFTVSGAFDGETADYILPNTEAYTGGGTSDGTSIFAVRFGRNGGQFFHAWDKHRLQVKDFGLLEDGVTMRQNVEWPLGLALFNPFSIARLRDLSWV